MTRSLRTRLTLWNLAVLALTLVAFGVAMMVSTWRQIEIEIDRDLLERARPPARVPGRGPGRGPGPRGPGPMGGPPPVGPNIPFFQGAPPDPVALFRRPHMIDPQGNALGALPLPALDPTGHSKAMSGQIAWSTIVRNGERVRVLSLPRMGDGQMALWSTRSPAACTECG